mmetsp:Transcript_27863/g.58615  ORF Transcript_27863/g.58615 Transcript_27863/m.58615 type:complete len:340 (-) Transcript_27863:2514-3533(-)
MDRLLEFLIASKLQAEDREGSIRRSYRRKPETFHFPNLKRIVVAGHSAGGQYVHRWTLLSSSKIIWGDDNNDSCSTTAKNREVEIRSAVANPRSYCYLDNRRMIRTDGNSSIDVDRYGANIADTDDKKSFKNNNVDEYRSVDGYRNVDERYRYAFAIPDRNDIEACPTYDQWQWGLQPGGDILAPYKDAALDRANKNTTTIALQYSKRKVFYLTGEQDTIVQEDRCETYKFQGDTRNERAKRYFRALTEYFAITRNDSGYHLDRSISPSTSKSRSGTPLIHEFHQVPGSPHDHTLMFQSAPGREAFFGNTLNTKTNGNKLQREDDNGGGKIGESTNAWD